MCVYVCVNVCVRVHVCVMCLLSFSLRRGFGYANFQSKGAAETAAKALNGFILSGQRMKTKGPGVLKQEGHASLKMRPNSPDYRPYTDCSFFIEGAKCKRKSVSVPVQGISPRDLATKC